MNQQTLNPRKQLRSNFLTWIVAAYVDMTVCLTTTAATASPPSKSQIAQAKEDVVSPQRQQELQQGLTSERSESRLAALQELVQLNEQAKFALPTLQTMLQQQVTVETPYVVRCLRNIGTPAAATAPRFHAILKGELPSQANTKNILPKLYEVLRNRPILSGLRFEAAAAMARMGTAGEVAIPTLIEMLKNPGPSVKTYLKPRKVRAPSAEVYAYMLCRSDSKGTYTDARDAYLTYLLGLLSQFGSAAEAATATIESVRDDPDTLGLVKQSAVKTLKQISKQPVDKKHN